MKNSRRSFLQKVGVSSAALAAAPFAVSASTAPASSEENEDEQYLRIGDDIAVANTSFGKIRGYQLNGVYTFLGVP